MDRLRNPSAWIGFLVVALGAAQQSGLVATGGAAYKALALAIVILGAAGSWFFGAGLSRPVSAAPLVALVLAISGCATVSGHYETIPPDPQTCAAAVLRAAAAQAPCDRTPRPPAQEILACTLAAAAEIMPCAPKMTWVADAAPVK